MSYFMPGSQYGQTLNQQLASFGGASPMMKPQIGTTPDISQAYGMDMSNGAAQPFSPQPFYGGASPMMKPQIGTTPDISQAYGMDMSNGAAQPFSPQPFYGTGAGQMGPAAQPTPTQYGYAQAPGQGPYGYYQQQTDAGSFAASNGADPFQQQYGQAYGASNPWIGQTSRGIGGQQSVMPYAQQIAGAARQANPWLGQTSQQAQSVGSNSYAGNNPFLGQQIQQAQDETSRAWNATVKPGLDSAMRASGSFGNTAIQEQQNNAYNDLGKQLGGIASGMRMQDYSQQQQLAENALNRQQAMNQFNAGLGAQDLNRNTAGFFTGQGMGLQGLNSLLAAGQFDATMGNNVNQFNAGLGSSDLNRNAGLAQSQGQFNAGQFGNMSQFNAGQGNNLGMFRAGQQQANNQFNTGQANQMLGQVRNLGQQADQFNQNMDFNTWQANNQNMRNGNLDQINLMNSLMGWNQQGLTNATTQQNTPLNYWQQFMQGANAAGGQGGTNWQTLQGNPWLGAFAGYGLGSRIGG